MRRNALHLPFVFGLCPTLAATNAALIIGISWWVEQATQPQVLPQRWLGIGTGLTESFPAARMPIGSMLSGRQTFQEFGDERAVRWKLIASRTVGARSTVEGTLATMPHCRPKGSERKTYGLGMTAIARFEYPLSCDSLFTAVAA